jgi:hypothetical protein
MPNSGKHQLWMGAAGFARTVAARELLAPGQQTDIPVGTDLASLEGTHTGS